MKKVAIITVNYNGKKDTIEFLKSLKKLNLGPFNTKIIVVDNASNDNSVEILKKNFPDIDIVQTGYIGGFTGGYNRGIEYAIAWGADYLLIINNDTLIKSPHLVTHLVRSIEDNPQIGVVTPKIYFAKGYEFYKDRYKPSELGKVLWYAGGKFDWKNVQSTHFGIDEVERGRYDRVEEVGLVTGCCFLTTKEVIEKVGYFDNGLFAYYEDNDFMERVTRAGFKKFYNGRVSIYHKVSQTAGIGSPFSTYFITRNKLIFAKRYASLRTNFALWRQAVKFLILGSDMQKRGVWDFIKGKVGVPKDIVRISEKPIYPIKLSIVIVNYNTSDLVKNLLTSIYFQKSGIDALSTEVILLDNGLLDPCNELVKQFPRVRYIVNKENTGFTMGYNRAVRYSRGEYVLMLNTDIEVLKNSLIKITQLAEKHSGNAVISGKLYFPNMIDQDSCFNLPTISGAIKEYFLGKKGAYFMYLPKSNKPIKVEGTVMACFLIPRKVINKIGILDEGTFMFFEDVEYCRRLKRNKIPIYFNPQAGFIHHHGASTKKLKEGQAYKMLVKGSYHYHGRIYYWILYMILLLGQKFSKVSTPAGIM